VKNGWRGDAGLYWFDDGKGGKASVSGFGSKWKYDAQTGPPTWGTSRGTARTMGEAKRKAESAIFDFQNYRSMTPLIQPRLP
jgi:hypothetical protein